MWVPRSPRAVARALPLVVGLAAVAAGCGANAIPGAGSQGGQGDQATPPEPPLAGRTFVAESVTENGQPRPPVEGTQIEITFPLDGGIGVDAGCNSMGGSLTVESDRLVVDDLAMTRMSCGPERDAQDTWLSGLLEADPAYRLQGSELRLQVGGTVMELAEAPDQDMPLEGPEWRLDAIVEGDVASPVPDGTGATLTFGDGGVGVNVVDCNVGSGDAVVSGSEIQVGTLMMTARACEPDPSMVESAVTSVLHGTISYAIDGDVLTLTHPSGQGLILRVAPDEPHGTG